MLNHLTKFQDGFSTIKFSTIFLRKGVYSFNMQHWKQKCFHQSKIILHSHCNQILFKLLLNIVYNVFKIKKKTPCILYKYLCANMLHVGDIYLTCTFISYILMFELRASLTSSIGRNAKLRSCSPIVWSSVHRQYGPQAAAMI